MFAVLSHKDSHNISFNRNDDFVIDNGLAEVKSIHDKFVKEALDKDSHYILKKSLPDNFGYDDVKEIICDQITEKNGNTT